MSKLEWKWGKPDSLGLWVYQHHGENRDVPHIVVNANFFNQYAQGWWCRLGDIPVIEMPKKKVTKRLWIKPTQMCALGPPERNAVFQMRWCKLELDPHFGWIRTDFTKEFEE